MYKPVFEGNNFSCYYERKTEQYMLYWAKYEITIILKDEEAILFKQLIEIQNSKPEKDLRARIERLIKIQFYFKFACPMPYFVEE